MRNVIQAAVLCAALPAAAQPVTEPRACQVTIARAPEDVRQVVEAWVRSEAQCSIALEVRIVPTEGGLYLLAQDEQGGIRERIVPDAQTAGVLVASWIADDNAPPLPAPAALAPPVAPAPASTPAYESLTPPGMAPLAITATAAAKPAPRSKWLTVGMILPMGPSSTGGIRGEIDVFRRGKWTLGAAGSIGGSDTTLAAYPSNGVLSMVDSKLVAYVARTSSWGRWHLRPSAGVGIMESTGDAYLDQYAQHYTLDGTFVALEASLAISRDLGKRWAAYAGPVAALVNQRYDVVMQATDQTPSYPSIMYRGGLDLSLFAGVRHRL